MPVQSRAASGQFARKSSNSSSKVAPSKAAEAPHQPMGGVATQRYNSDNNSSHHTPNHSTNIAIASITNGVPGRVHSVANGSGGAAPHGQHTVDASDDGPPAKRRRLSIRTAKHQTTLDSFAYNHHHNPPQPKPPSRVTVQQPHGKLVQTINGVRTALDADEDELLRPTPKPERVPQRATRSPQPAPPPQKQEDKRTLRSQDDGPRLKSELAIYFPNYEEVIFDAPREEEFLSGESALYVTDDAKPTKPETASPAKPGKNTVNGRRISVNGTAASQFTPQRNSATHFNGSPILNFDVMARTLPEKPEDPLTDEHFLKSHRRAERKEKQLRNIEKERAMHEKVQLERLLDGLQGHDWLRVLGITGVTDTEAKKYEPKRDYFIAEVKALVDKFRQWREQEKKQRIDKEAAAAAKEAEEEEGESTEGSIEPPSSDLNASAAKQLQQETVNTLRLSSAKPSGKGKERIRPTSHPSQPATPTAAPPKLMLPPPPPSPELPITSFYAKRHLRDAALGKARHGRNVTAFGQPIPDMEEQEFELPDDYVTEDALRANARERRRRKRESVANTGSKAA